MRRRSELHKNHPARTGVFCRGGNKNEACAYKTIVSHRMRCAYKAECAGCSRALDSPEINREWEPLLASANPVQCDGACLRIQRVSKKCPSTPCRFAYKLALRESRQLDSNRRPADCQSVAFLKSRYLGRDILAEEFHGRNQA